MNNNQNITQLILPTAIFLDMDDTLLVDDALSEPSWRTVCGQYSNRLHNLSADLVYHTIRAASNKYWSDGEKHRLGRLDLYQARRDVVNMAFADLGLQIPGLAVEMADAFSAVKEAAIAPFPGVMAALHSLKTQGLRLALITNGSSLTQRKKINRFGLEPFFDCVLIEEEFGVGKPDERVFRAALDNLQVQPSGTWMVGNDLNHDIAGAQKLGILGVWIDRKKTGLPFQSTVKPDRIILDLTELLPYRVWSRRRARD